MIKQRRPKKKKKKKEVGPRWEEAHCQVPLQGERFLNVGRTLLFLISFLWYLVELFLKFWELDCLIEQIPGKVSFLSTEGKRQIPLNEQFLKKCPSASLKPEEILISVNIPYSRKVRIFLLFCGFTCEPTAFFFFFNLFRAMPAVYGGAQARGPIIAVATGHSHTGSEPCLWPTP